jgi:hypothetical protein
MIMKLEVKALVMMPYTAGDPKQLSWLNRPLAMTIPLPKDIKRSEI